MPRRHVFVRHPFACLQDGTKALFVRVLLQAMNILKLSFQIIET